MTDGPRMVRLVLVTVLAAALLVPSVAHAGWTVLAPKGWKAPPADQAAAMQKSASEKFGPNATVVMRQWLAPGNQGLLNVVHITMPLERTTTASELVNSIATGTAKTIDATGLKLVKQTTA